MSLMLKQLFGFFKLLNSDTGTNQIAAGLAIGVVLGFSPLFSLQGLLIIILIFFFRFQMGAAFISAFFFKFTAFLLDPVTDSLGKNVLESESLRPLFIQLYNMPIVPLTRFNNSIIMGSAVISFALVVPLFFCFKVLVIKYRANVVNKFKQSKIWKAWSATTVYKMYSKYNDLYG